MNCDDVTIQNSVAELNQHEIKFVSGGVVHPGPQRCYVHMEYLCPVLAVISIAGGAALLSYGFKESGDTKSIMLGFGASLMGVALLGITFAIVGCVKAPSGYVAIHGSRAGEFISS